MSSSYKPDGSLDPLLEYNRLFPSNPRWNNIEGNHLTNSEYESLNVFFEEPQLNTGITSNQSNFLDRSDQSLPVEQRLDSTSEINDSKASQYQPQLPSDYYTITNLTSNTNNNTQFQCASCCQQRFSPNYYFIPGANMSYHSQYLPQGPPIYVQSKVQNKFVLVHFVERTFHVSASFAGKKTLSAYHLFNYNLPRHPQHLVD